MLWYCGLVLTILTRYEEWHRKYFDLKPETTKELPRTDLAKETIRSQRNKGLAGVIGLVMKADGVASKEELEGVASYLKRHYKSADFEEIMKALKVNLKINNPNFVKQSCNWLTANMSHSERLGFCEFLFDIARLSQGIAEAEWKRRYYPDTVQDEEMKLVLTEKFKEISLAYSFLTK